MGERTPNHDFYGHDNWLDCNIVAMSSQPSNGLATSRRIEQLVEGHGNVSEREACNLRPAGSVTYSQVHDAVGILMFMCYEKSVRGTEQCTLPPLEQAFF